MIQPEIAEQNVVRLDGVCYCRSKFVDRIFIKVQNFLKSFNKLGFVDSQAGISNEQKCAIPSPTLELKPQGYEPIKVENYGPIAVPLEQVYIRSIKRATSKIKIC